MSSTTTSSSSPSKSFITVGDHTIQIQKLLAEGGFAFVYLATPTTSTCLYTHSMGTPSDESILSGSKRIYAFKRWHSNSIDKLMDAMSELCLTKQLSEYFGSIEFVDSSIRCSINGVPKDNLFIPKWSDLSRLMERKQLSNYVKCFLLKQNKKWTNHQKSLLKNKKHSSKRQMKNSSTFTHKFESDDTLPYQSYNNEELLEMLNENLIDEWNVTWEISLLTNYYPLGSVPNFLHRCMFKGRGRLKPPINNLPSTINQLSGGESQWKEGVISEDFLLRLLLRISLILYRLHHLTGTPVAHFDVKLENILIKSKKKDDNVNSSKKQKRRSIEREKQNGNFKSKSNRIISSNKINSSISNGDFAQTADLFPYECVLCDYGSARIIPLSRLYNDHYSLDEFIQSYTTPSNRSPEMIQIHECPTSTETISIDDKSDIWAFGCLTYRLCFGSLPFGLNTFAMQTGDYTIPSTCRYSTNILKLIKILLTVNVQQRPSSFQLVHLISEMLNKQIPSYVSNEKKEKIVRVNDIDLKEMNEEKMKNEEEKFKFSSHNISGMMSRDNNKVTTTEVRPRRRPTNNRRIVCLNPFCVDSTHDHSNQLNNEESESDENIDYFNVEYRRKQEKLNQEIRRMETMRISDSSPSLLNEMK
ncbi:hypothetical protein SNEBB_009019 [Seison nebaliae]|nr:hypothetical protein SNEBB_009019 [Seison nebaliae]